MLNRNQENESININNMIITTPDRVVGDKNN
jgi:hypothetical protein